MITDFIKDGVVWFRCNECGSEHRVLQYEISKHYDFPVINIEKSIEAIHNFETKHALCKQDTKQTNLFTP